jgi:hypothetical protein
VSANEYIVDAKIPIDEFNELVNAKLTDEEYDTLGGFVYTQLDKIPSVGDEVRHDGLTFTVLGTRGLRVTKVKVVRGTSEPEPAVGAGGATPDNEPAPSATPPTAEPEGVVAEGVVAEGVVAEDSGNTRAVREARVGPGAVGGGDATNDATSDATVHGGSGAAENNAEAASGDGQGTAPGREITPPETTAGTHSGAYSGTRVGDAPAAPPDPPPSVNRAPAPNPPVRRPADDDLTLPRASAELRLPRQRHLAGRHIASHHGRNMQQGRHH